LKSHRQAKWYWNKNVCYSFTTAQIISRFTHRGSVEIERVLRRLWDANRRTPLRGVTITQICGGRKDDYLTDGANACS
jgi:hypothetical protein